MSDSLLMRLPRRVTADPCAADITTEFCKGHGLHDMGAPSPDEELIHCLI